MSQQGNQRLPQATAAPRRTWVAPRVEDLPRLTELTLQSIPADCDVEAGSTCF
jgi:hypothetical protein